MNSALFVHSQDASFQKSNELRFTICGLSLLLLSMFLSDRLLAEHGLKQPCISNPPAFHWELGSNIWMPRNKSNLDVLPCITKSHMIWDVRKGRPWLGSELMQAQGFPKDMKLVYDPDDETLPPSIHNAIARLGRTCVSDRELKHMAGNTMTIPIMGILQVRRGQSVMSTFRIPTYSNIFQQSSKTNQHSNIFQQYSAVRQTSIPTYSNNPASQFQLFHIQQSNSPAIQPYPAW